MPQDQEEYQIPKYESETINPEILAPSEALVVPAVPVNEVIPTSYYEKKVANTFAAEKTRSNLERMDIHRASILEARTRLIEKTLFVRRSSQNWGQKAVGLLIGGNIEKRSNTFGAPQDLTEQRLMQLESEIGSELLGAPQNGGQQTFFMNETGDWFWHSVTEDGKNQLTTRYRVSKDGVLKIQDGRAYETIAGEEVNRLVDTVELYHSEVTRRIYGQSDYNLAA